MRKGLLLGLTATLAVLGASCGLLEEEVPTAEVGECITNDVTGTGTIGEFETVDCTEPHTAELYAKFSLPDGDFPGTTAVAEQANEGCIEEFEAYVGSTPQESEIGIAPVSPTEQTWNEADDREVLCFGANLDGSELTESIEGSAR